MAETEHNHPWNQRWLWQVEPSATSEKEGDESVASVPPHEADDGPREECAEDPPFPSP